MAKSQGGRGNAVLTGFRLHRPAAEPSALGQIHLSFGQECPGAGIQAIHRCLGHRLGSHVQWARSSGVWMGLQLCLHSNCLELLAEFLSLSRLRWRLQGKDVLVHTENMATFLHISSGNAVYAPVACATHP